MTRYFKIRRLDDPDIFYSTDNGFTPFSQSTTIKITADNENTRTYLSGLAKGLPPSCELVEVTFQPVRNIAGLN